ncbi:hypothetical protein K456DRAFT_59332 [Colletotrichum gloeosporioides 23]|nr:hypothetical protein K456DRAFT_59332 [Colletotrichum gloeosporioides 23]
MAWRDLVAQIFFFSSFVPFTIYTQDWHAGLSKRGPRTDQLERVLALGNPGWLETAQPTEISVLASRLGTSIIQRQSLKSNQNVSVEGCQSWRWYHTAFWGSEREGVVCRGCGVQW